MGSYWVHCEIIEPIEDFSRFLHNSLPNEPEYYIEKTPHITIIPEFSINNPNELTLPEPPTELEIEGFHLHPSEEKPMVISFKINPEPIEQYREEVLKLIEKHGGTIEDEPVTPHVTLIKGGNVGDKHSWERPISEQTIEQTNTRIQKQTIPFETVTVETAKIDTVF